eukprot:gnl/TRDRNA2_/TRDRNA2_155486_c2_seq2.p1 gnl/TRDRNA2_/TRDRNA2_155486_c2~~gnl/TRDRNA2_/TRDRNA2_155486_c2_seq2.p1  ORF type:complete len:107 (+),score=22.67 gnl/TRDRNA2_/TRDRNA2_155486_c2_seq2:79-399(+)
MTAAVVRDLGMQASTRQGPGEGAADLVQAIMPDTAATTGTESTEPWWTLWEWCRLYRQDQEREGAAVGHPLSCEASLLDVLLEVAASRRAQPCAELAAQLRAVHCS